MGFQGRLHYTVFEPRESQPWKVQIMTEIVKVQEKGSGRSMGSTFRYFLFVRLPPTIIGFLSCHLLFMFIYILLKITRGSTFFGAEVRVTNSVLLGSVYSHLTTFAIKIIPFSVALSTLLALLSLFFHFRIWTWKESWRLGWVSYILVSIFLILRYPGVLISIPVVQLLPLPYWLCYLVLLSFGAILVTFLPGQYPDRAGFILLLILVTFIPHGLFRNAYHALHGKVLPPGRTSVLFLGLDSARLDDVRTQNIRRNVYPGLSHFQSTRKQWRILLGEEPVALYDSLFVPSQEDGQAPHSTSFLERRSASGGLRIAFLLDDGGTANRQTLRLGFSEVRINQEGIALGGAPAAIPIACWLQNIFAFVEGSNPFSDVDVFLHDTRKALSRNDVVFAHTCYLQFPLRSFEDFVDFDGWRWLARSPIQFTQIKVTKAGTSSLPRKIATFGTARLLNKVSALMDAVEREQPGCSGLMTSDHGQDFGETSSRNLSSTHGFNASPDCAWIPIIPFGRTLIQADHGHQPLTWDDFRGGIHEVIGTGGPLRLIPTSKPILSAFPYICPPNDSTMQDQIDILNMKLLSKSINFERVNGLQLSPKVLLRNYQKSYTAYQAKTGYVTLNPIGSGRYLFEAWDGYLLREKAEIQHQELRPLLVQLGFPVIE